jgi:predicted RecA/RadA family phage recombinase
MLQPGNIYQHSASAAITKGRLLRVGTRLVGVPLISATGAAVKISVALDGIHQLDSVATGAKAAGAKCYFRSTGSQYKVAMTATGSTGATGATGSRTAFVIGTLWEAAATTATTVKVRLVGRPMRKL